MEPGGIDQVEEKRLLAALGEVPLAELDAEERAKVAELAGVVATMRALHAVPTATAAAETAVPGEFQIARMEHAVYKAAAAVRKEKYQRSAWRHLAVAAAVLLMGVLLALVLRQENSSPAGSIARHDAPADPSIGVRSGGEKHAPPANPTPIAQPLAPLGSIHIRSPLSFIWKADPRTQWELRLYRQGESEPLATVADTKSPYPIERLLPEADALITGGSFRWELVNTHSGEIAALGGFQLSPDAPSYPVTEIEALRTGMATATAAGRPSEALILLFSLHNELSPEEFIHQRRELERAILKK